MKGFLRFLKQTAVCEHMLANTSDHSGQVSTSYQEYGSYRCAIQAMGGNQVMLFAGLGIQAQFVGFFEPDVPVVLGDRISVDGIKYYVQYLERLAGHRAQHVELALKMEVQTRDV